MNIIDLTASVAPSLSAAMEIGSLALVPLGIGLIALMPMVGIKSEFERGKEHVEKWEHDHKEAE